MDNRRVEPCCPSDPQRKAAWIEKLQNEKEELLLKLGETITDSESMLRALSHNIRILILMELGARPHCVCELVEKTSATNSAISYHLSFLVKLSIIQAENRAGNSYYFLTDYGKKVLDWVCRMPHRESAIDLVEPAKQTEESR